MSSLFYTNPKYNFDPQWNKFGERAGCLAISDAGGGGFITSFGKFFTFLDTFLHL